MMSGLGHFVTFLDEGKGLKQLSRGLRGIKRALKKKKKKGGGGGGGDKRNAFQDKTKSKTRK